MGVRRGRWVLRKGARNGRGGWRECRSGGYRRGRGEGRHRRARNRLMWRDGGGRWRLRVWGWVGIGAQGLAEARGGRNGIEGHGARIVTDLALETPVTVPRWRLRRVLGCRRGPAPARRRARSGLLRDALRAVGRVPNAVANASPFGLGRIAAVAALLTFHLQDFSDGLLRGAQGKSWGAIVRVPGAATFHGPHGPVPRAPKVLLFAACLEGRALTYAIASVPQYMFSRAPEIPSGDERVLKHLFFGLAGPRPDYPFG